VQSIFSLLPVGESEFDMHGKQTSAVFAPIVPEYFPCRQLLQSASPGTDLNLPAAQFVHIPPKGPVEPALQAQSINASLPTGEFESTVHD